ncbi:MAG: PAS domain S-box protein [Alphaproteobacteria bacterium]|nr:PAS domain S-box protein [Alphaproteobacteria bacterium]
MPSLPTNAADPTTMHESDRRALLDFAVGQTDTVFYIAALHGERRTQFISDNIVELTGHSAADFVEQSGFGLRHIHVGDQAAYLDAIARLPDVGASTLEYRFAAKDGEWRWIRDTLHLAMTPDDGDEANFVGCMIDITDQKHATLRMTEAEAIKQALLDTAMDAIVAMDPDGVIVEFNATAEIMFGYSRAEAVGQTMADLIIPEIYRARHDAGLRRFLKTGRTAPPKARIEVEAMRRDGTLFPVEITIAATEIHDQLLFIGEIRDTSDRHAAVEERRRLTQLIQDAIESLPDGFTISHADGRVLFCNKAFAAPYGDTPEAMIGRTRTENIERFCENVRRFDGKLVAGDRAYVPWIVERLSNLSGDPIEMELTNGDWREMSCHPTSDGGTVTIRRDITERKQNDLALRESEAMVRRILDACPVPVGMTRYEDGKILYESPASKRLFLRDADKTPLSARSFFVNPEDRNRYLEALARYGQVDGFETFLKRTDGTEFCASLSARVVEYQGERVIVSSTYDLTERRHMENEMARQQDALHQSEKLSALGELLAGISHELNNPLSVVVGQTMLMRETATDPKTAERARKIGEAAERCARIIRTFLAMARQQPAKTKAVDMNAVIEQVLEVTGYTLRSAEIDVSLELSDNTPPILADGDQINQVLTNLTINAHHALADAPRPRRLRLMTRYDRGKNEVVLSVVDNGCGVPAAVASRVFEPFFTTREVGQGTGLGLAISHRIVEAHGGRIKMEETPGGGATFVLRFPALTTRAADAQPDADTHQDIDRMHVLVVDDEPTVAEMIRDVLEADGHRVDIANSGRAAVERLRLRHYDAILSDLRMPDLDGPALFQILNEQYPAIINRIAFITGDTMSPAIRQFLVDTGRPHIEKPVTPSDLRTLVDQLIAGAKPA